MGITPSPGRFPLPGNRWGIIDICGRSARRIGMAILHGLRQPVDVTGLYQESSPVLQSQHRPSTHQMNALPLIVRPVLLSCLLAILVSSDLQADDSQSVTQVELREQLKGLTPEEREQKLKELRRQAGVAAVTGEGRGGYQPPEQAAAMSRRLAEQFQNLPPEQREAKMREMREQFEGLTPEDRAAKLRELQGGMAKGRTPAMGRSPAGLQNLPPDQREARMREQREQFERMTPEERAMRLKELREQNPQPTPESGPRPAFSREQLEKAFVDLKQKETAGTLSHEETQQLRRLEEFRKRAGQGLPNGGPPGPRRGPANP